MAQRRLSALLWLCIYLGSNFPLIAQFRSFETRNLRLVYFEEFSYLTEHVARCFENSLRFQKKLFDYTPSGRVTILLNDFADYGYGGTSTIPWNYIIAGIEPFDYVYETRPANERMNWMMNHEMVHVVATDKAAGSDRFFRSLFFGKVPPTADEPVTMLYSYLTSPRWYSPRWYHEGIAVFLETWMAGGLGRALGGFDEMVFRTMMRDSARTYGIVGLESEGTAVDFQIGANSYLYGTRFVTYMAQKAGPEKIIQWFNRDKGSRRTFSAQFKRVYGMPLTRAWSEWITFEKEWQAKNCATLNEYPVTHGRPVISEALGSVSRAYYDPEERKLYTAVNFPGQIAHIASIGLDNGRVENITAVPTPALYYVASLAYDPQGKKIYYTTHNSSRFRSLNVVDVRTGKSKVLIANCRTGDLVFHPKDQSIWGVQHHNGKSILVRFPAPYDRWQEVLVLDYGKDIIDLDISPDGGTLVATLAEISGRQRLIRMDMNKLMEKEGDFEVLHEFPDNAASNFVYSPDGKFLFGTSYLTSVSNVWRYDFSTGSMDILTNAETGFFRPVPVSDDSMAVFRYSGQGFQPMMVANRPLQDVNAVRYLGQQVAEKYPLVESWNVGSPLAIQLDSLKIRTGSYHPFTAMRLSSVYPVLHGYKEYMAFGLRVNFMDPAGLNGLALTLSYSPHPHLENDEKIHGALTYRAWPWEFRAMYNYDDFYDLFGPTKVSRKGYAASVQYNNFIFNDKPRTLEYTVTLAGYGGLETLPDYQNVAASYDKFATLKLQVHYQYFLRSLGAVEYERGLDWQLNQRTNLVNATWYPRVYGSLDYGFLLPLMHSSVWIRSSAGYSVGAVDEPFANFYFGGFGNNWIDYQEIDRYRLYYSFPGTEINGIGGVNFARVMLEWTLPPIRFREFGVPSFYFRWARFALFSSALATNLGSEAEKRSLLNAGIQLNIRLVSFSLFNSTLSLGYAFAFEEDQRMSREFMVSLRIL